MYALVTGGAGFIGSHLSNKLLKLGAKVTIVDNLSTGTESNIPSKCDFICLDLTENNFINKLPITTTHVFHLAAQSSGEISFEDPRYDIEINTVSTLELLKWSLNHNVKKLIYTSSMNVYGYVNDEPIKETQPVAPESFYAVGKSASENYIKIFSDLGLNSTILRLFNVYGPGQNMENLKQGMLSIFLADIMKNKPVLVKGSLERFRDFIYIDDVISAIEKSINFTQKYDVFNICTGIRTTVQEALDKLFIAFNLSNYQIIESDGTPRDQFGIYGNIHKSEKLLDWKYKVKLEDGLNKLKDFCKIYESRS